MKKLIVGLLAAFLMTTGLVAFSSSPSSAAPADCPYDGCVATNTVGVGVGVIQKRKGKKNIGKGIIAVRVDAQGSNTVPVGKVDLTVKKKGSTKIKYTDTANVNQRGKVKFTTGKLGKKATWLYLVEFADNEANGWSYSRDKGNFSF